MQWLNLNLFFHKRDLYGTKTLLYLCVSAGNTRSLGGKKFLGVRELKSHNITHLCFLRSQMVITLIFDEPPKSSSSSVSHSCYLLPPLAFLLHVMPPTVAANYAPLMRIR
ncbi:hypothetical protein TNIN_258301 [Trichonephila inaurata madagascariensis]|uniref:Uncharacterized protein n=1 Tax=Trichonephila inaurata madagascariensis TaxID=2747483 RepID=A0A8X6YTC2_9ARAC|nr:hypothetical protein TNIN_258301 [Trichonephila inaurata madagascariensis]